MKKECIDKNEGIKLHAYELDLLSERDTEKFEIHLLGCDRCLEQVNSFHSDIRLLNSNKTIKDWLKKAVQKYVPAKTATAAAGRFQMPSGISFKLVVGMVIMAVIISAGYFWLSPEKTHHSQQIKLIPSRSVSPNIIADPATDFEFIFAYDNSVAGKCYQVEILNSADESIYENSRFCDFNEQNIGRIMLRGVKFSPGHYKMTISDPEELTQSATQEYRFTISTK